MERDKTLQTEQGERRYVLVAGGGRAPLGKMKLLTSGGNLTQKGGGENKGPARKRTLLSLNQEDA